MKIYAFTTSYPCPYRTFLDTQFAEFVRAGHDLTIFAVTREGSTLNERVVAHRLDERVMYHAIELRAMGPFLPTIAREIASRPGAAWSRGLGGWRVGGSLKARARMTLQALRMPGEQPDLCLVHGTRTLVSLTWLRTAYPGAVVAFYYHGGENPNWMLPERAVKRALASVDVVFTNTEFSRQHAIGRGCDPALVHVVPVGFALEDYPETERRYRADGQLHILTAARMAPEKGHLHALEAVRSLIGDGVTNLTYSLTGDGSMLPRIESFVAQHRLQPYVRLLGSVTTRRVIQAMGEADVLVQPSVEIGSFAENQACAVQEAMLMRTPVITTRTGGMPESIPDFMEGFSVPPADPSSIRRALEAILSLSDAELASLGSRARAWAAGRYDVRLLNRRFTEVVPFTAPAASPALEPA